MNDFIGVNEAIRLKIKEIKRMAKIDKHLAHKMENKLVMSLSYLVKSVIFKYKKYNNYDDLYQEGMVGLIKAVRQYNSDMSFHFSRYALLWIRTCVMRSIKKINVVSAASSSNIIVKVIYEVNDEDIILNNTLEKNMLLNEQIVRVNRIITTLPEKHQRIVKMRYGLEDVKEHNLQELASNFNMTREGIRQLEGRILKKIKNNKSI